MFTKISVLIPTRQRVNTLRTMLHSYAMTTRGVESSSEIVFRVDADDVDTQDFLWGMKGHKMFIGPRYDGYRSLPLFFNELAGIADGDVLLCGNDDIMFKTEHWAPRILAKANEYPDGVFDIGVSTHNETHYPLSIVSKKAVERMGFIFDPRVFWGDIFLRDVMAQFGRSVMLPDVHIEHEWAGHKPDAVFTEGEAVRRADHTGDHVAVAISEAVEKLRGLQ